MAANEFLPAGSIHKARPFFLETIEYKNILLGHKGTQVNPVISDALMHNTDKVISGIQVISEGIKSAIRDVMRSLKAAFQAGRE